MPIFELFHPYTLFENLVGICYAILMQERTQTLKTDAAQNNTSQKIFPGSKSYSLLCTKQLWISIRIKSHKNVGNKPDATDA